MPSAKKIIFIIDRIESGGAEKQMLKLAAFCRGDYEVFVTSLYPPSPSGHELILQSRVKYMPLSISDNSIIGRLSNVLKRFFALKKLIKSIDPDKCVSFLEWSNVYSLICTRKSDIKTYCNVRNFLSIQYGSRSKYLLKFAQIVFSLSYSKATMILCNSHAIKDDLILNFNIKPLLIEVIFNSYDFEYVLASAKKKTTYSPPILKEGNKVFVSSGRFSSQKRFSALIQNFILFQKKSGRRDTLLIFGEGPLQKELYNISIGHSVSILEYQDNPYSIMAQCDCFILHSEFEGFPNVLAEACILNLDIISTDCLSGPREILSGGKFCDYNTPIESIMYMDNGILYPRNNSSQIEDLGLINALEYYVSSDYVKKEKSIDFLDKKVGDIKWQKLL